MATININTEWNKLAKEIKSKNRFFHKENGLLNFIDNEFEGHVIPLKKGQELYRARLTELSKIRKMDGRIAGFGGKDSIAPPDGAASSGRANPAYISYLYTAEDAYTAMSEIDFDLESFISVAKIQATEDLKIFNLWFDANSDEESEFRHLGIRFSQVVDKGQETIDYLVRQYVAEHIKNKGVDGIRYTSLKSGYGCNVVIFSKEKMKFIQSKIFYSHKIEFSFFDITDQKNYNAEDNVEQKRDLGTIVKCVEKHLGTINKKTKKLHLNKKTTAKK